MLNHVKSFQFGIFGFLSEATGLGLLHTSEVELELLDHTQQLPPGAALGAKFQRHWALSCGVLAKGSTGSKGMGRVHGTSRHMAGAQNHEKTRHIVTSRDIS